ncbi:serine-rich adhesin for platelets-like isoform X2 [Penaeus indicus]|uniref:serine-rich adhesin for platelets-like isoform X2 n=1 Tax=Penaeus indicus TaxID=29960 RepID=UPI00300BFBCD
MCEVESQGLPGHGGALSVSCPKADIQENGTETLGELEITPGESPGSRRSSKSSHESLGVTPRTSQELIVKDSPVDEGVDPFSSRLTPESSSPTERRGSKTVNFKEMEDEEEEVSQAETDRARSRSSSISTSSSATSSSKALSPGTAEEGTAGVTRRQRSLGDANPVYRLSMKLSPNLFNMTDIPGASQHREPEKAGYLTKLSGRSFPYIPQWKRRYCVLAKGKLYYYEREDSKAGDKSNGVINLEYFDQVAEAGPKDCKKATNVFIITSQDRSFFDPGRHLFSADTLPDMKDWIRKLQSALDQIRNNNRPATSTSSSVKEGGKRRKEDNAENKENVQTATKERKKKKEDSYRARKSTRVGVSSESQTEVVMAERDSEPPVTPPHKGVQLPGMSAHKGIQLPGMVPTEASRPAAASTPTEVAKEPEDNEDGLPTAGPTLTCVTKQRVKGPQGRRAPQNRRTLAAAAMKNRASSLSALEYQELNDNSEAPWLNRSLDMLEDGERGGDDAPGGPAPANGSQLALAAAAYAYSSEEDADDDDGEHSHADSLPTSASAMPPPPPPRSASYGMELRRPPYLAQLGHQAAHASRGEGGGSMGELREPKRRQGDGRGYGGGRAEWRGSSGDNWEGSRRSLSQPRDPGTSASPVMDDLDNMLMNESIHQTSGIMDSASDAGSDGSTCRASDRPRNAHHQHQPAHHYEQPRKKTPDLSRFTTAVRHLQRHVVEIDRAVFGITGDVTGTRQEVTSLKEAVLALQADTDTITSTLAHLTEEAIAAQQKISLAKQEAEGIQRSVKVALAEAEQAKRDQQRTRQEYEELLLEMRNMVREMKETRDVASGSLPSKSTYSSGGKFSLHGSSVKESQSNKDQNIHKIQHSSSLGKLPQCSLKFSSSISKEQQTGDKERTIWSKPYQPIVKEHRHESKQAETRNLTTTQKSSTDEHSTKTSGGHGTSSSASSGSSNTKVPESSTVSTCTTSAPSQTSSQATSTTKTPPYQSLFSRPSSLLSSLTNRSSLTKSVSFADQKDKETADSGKGQSTAERKKKEDKHHSSDKKNKDDSKHHKDDKKHTGDSGSKERRSKDRKDHSSIDRKERKEKKDRHESKEKKSNLKEQSDSGNIISNISLEDIPMADEHSQDLLDNKSSALHICSSSISLVPPANYSLGKSSSTPVVTYTNPGNRPRALPLNREHQRGDFSNSMTESPESPLAPSPFPRSASALPPLDESNSFSETSSLTSFHRPGSTPGPLARQGSMTTVPEDRAVVGPPLTKKPGKFAISRQNSSPNIPLQRQNSAPAFPLQRQHSLGVVPENGRLPRQESLMSVPEERPITDQTLPLSPTPSMTYFPISPCASLSAIAEPRPVSRTSMELVTGPVLAGSSLQEASATGTLPVLMPLEEEEEPSKTSTLKKDFKSHKDVLGILV